MTLDLKKSLNEPRGNSWRVVELDSVRGIAAAMVVWHHWHNAFWATSPPWFVFPLTAGHEAVLLFFVLSGYVLSLPVWKDKAPGYPEYLARRVSRIYLPYLGALALAIAGCYFFHNVPLALTSDLNKIWMERLSSDMIFRHLAMGLDPTLNTAFWTLRYELAMSIIFPAICLLMLRTGRYSGIFLALGVRLLSYITGHWLVGSDLPLLLYYACFFIMGAELSRHREALLRAIGKLNLATAWLLLALALGAYFNIAFLHESLRTGDAITGFGALLLLILVQDRRLHIGLRRPFALYLGRISFSLYLVHVTVLVVLLHLGYGHMPRFLLGVVYGAITLLVAHFFNKWVEEPSLAVGKRLGGWLRTRRPVWKLRLIH
jgi:peptidoglycan/LPS O-acetylase OafA/YrhL